MLLKRFSLKSLMIICATIILCTFLVGVVFYKLDSQMVIAQTKNEAMGLAWRAAKEIDGDVFVSIDSEEHSGFKEVYDKLSEYKTNESLQFIYAMKQIKEKEIVFVVDTDEIDPADIFEPYEWLPSMGPAFDGEVCADEDFTSDEWGTYLSGYAPIFDSQNKVVGIVGCDITIDTINARLAKLRILIIIFGVIPNMIIAMMLWREAKS